MISPPWSVSVTSSLSPTRSACRAFWRIVSSIDQKEESRGNDERVKTIRDYKAKVESELAGICDGILKLLDSALTPLLPRIPTFSTS
ncbi:hypothetical protein Bca4012_017597 [Brassica carinata]|uniref:14-3-3 domain-containing protein n=1 Tax=Brassica carinata TaxID=52824 RepID=A0A8X7WN06_BRACI|nr:hypothetical protein Bca52824_003951 [Brassica carinata]